MQKLTMGQAFACIRAPIQPSTSRALGSSTAHFWPPFCLQATDMKQHFALLSLFNTKLLSALSSSSAATDSLSANRSSIEDVGGPLVSSSCRSGNGLLMKAGSRSSIDAGIVSGSDSNDSRLPKASLDDEQCSLVLQVWRVRLV